MSYYSEYDETEKDVWPRRRERGRSASPPRRRRSADEREGYLEERQTERYRHDRAEMRVSFSSERERARSPPPPRALRRRRSADHGSPVRRRRSRSPDAREYLQSDRGGSSDAANRPLESLEGMFQVLCPPSFFTPEELRTLEVRSNAKIRMSSEPFPEQSDHVLTIKGSVNGIRTVIGEVLAALFEVEVMCLLNARAYFLFRTTLTQCAPVDFSSQDASVLNSYKGPQRFMNS